MPHRQHQSLLSGHAKMLVQPATAQEQEEPPANAILAPQVVRPPELPAIATLAPGWEMQSTRALMPQQPRLLHQCGAFMHCQASGASDHPTAPLSSTQATSVPWPYNMIDDVPAPQADEAARDPATALTLAT